MTFKPQDGRSYTINQQGLVLLIDGKEPTEEDKKQLLNQGIAFVVKNKKKNKEVKNVTT